MQDFHKSYAYLQYVGHIAVMTGKTKEALQINGIENISAVLSKLDELYPGFREVFVPAGGVFNSRTGIILRRGCESRPVIDQEQRLEEGDVITFW